VSQTKSCTSPAINKKISARAQRNCFAATARAKKCKNPTTGNSESATQTKKLRKPDVKQNNQPSELDKGLSLTPLKQKARGPNRRSRVRSDCAMPTLQLRKSNAK
jgi:hypothetical protein